MRTSGFKRSSGLLLHPTSFPGPFGIGDFGAEARSFIDTLEKSGQSLWQVLPLGPTGYGDSPYSSFSSFAGNPLLISPDLLLQSGVLEIRDLEGIPEFDPRAIDFGRLIPWKMSLLNKGAEQFLKGLPSHLNSNQTSFRTFCSEESDWLDDYAFYMALKEVFDQQAQDERVFGAMWSNYWDQDIALREPEAMIRWSKKLADRIEIQKVLQYFFFTQWRSLKQYANDRGILIIGDIPIFTASDSADVWAHRDLFLLDDRGTPLQVTGVPPDYFSETGQLWGNPVYNWPRMEENRFQWWITRIQKTLEVVDIIRVDHFRGFEAYWSVPFGEKTAVNGKWIKAPGQALFKEVHKVLGSIPLLAEDLGVITDEVNALRDRFSFPGMRILQFAFDGDESGQGLNPSNPFFPHNYIQNSVVYTGTHDNATMMEWLETCREKEKKLIQNYTGCKEDDLVGALIRTALSSVAVLAIFPMQDLLRLGSEGRMNIPSTLGGNWTWRYKKGDLTSDRISELTEWTVLYGRRISEDLRVKSQSSSSGSPKSL